MESYLSYSVVLFTTIAASSSVHTLTPGLIQAVCKKQLDQTWLCAGISPLRYGL